MSDGEKKSLALKQSKKNVEPCPVHTKTPERNNTVNSFDTTSKTTLNKATLDHENNQIPNNAVNENMPASTDFTQDKLDKADVFDKRPTLQDENNSDKDMQNSNIQLSNKHDVDQIPKKSIKINPYSYHFEVSDVVVQQPTKVLPYQPREPQTVHKNPSIYKLSFDDSLSDLSESSSPSSVEPELNIPTLQVSDEVIVDETDCLSDAGSEEIDFPANKYDDDCFLTNKNNMYFNRLSLAVELLRTRETLSYDEEYQRVVDIDFSPTGLVRAGQDNGGFMDESPAVKNAKDMLEQSELSHDSSSGIRTGFRRFGVQFQHYFSPLFPRINPCCCALQ